MSRNVPRSFKGIETRGGGRALGLALARRGHWEDKGKAALRPLRTLARTCWPRRRTRLPLESVRWWLESCRKGGGHSHGGWEQRPSSLPAEIQL